MRPDRFALARPLAPLAPIVLFAALVAAPLAAQQPVLRPALPAGDGAHAAATGALAATVPQAPLAPAHANAAGPVPLVFLANHGQWPSEARFVMRHRSFAAQMRRDGIQLQRERTEPTPLGVAVRLSFVGTDGVDPVVAEAATTRVHSFTDGAVEATDLRAATALRYRDLWPGIDLVVHDCAGELEYDVELSPGADLAAVAFRCEGGEATIDAEGCLVVKTELGDLRQLPPRTWETGEEGESFPVVCRFALLADGSYGFDVERRDPSRKLVVDPVILWATYFGASGDDLAFALDVFPNGEVVVCGQTSSLPTFPTTCRCRVATCTTAATSTCRRTSSRSPRAARSPSATCAPGTPRAATRP